ncbi:MAG TPA: hypothetical protein PKW55_08725 [Spirochaetota bacterium]|nr:hypothetical protein [Spirochaetota bacterium]HOM39160.1 hypothetical protein [Spirochaetota bacterium]HPQ48337.1 hypothetical protein [Spirochaetota bacterium]
MKRILFIIFLFLFILPYQLFPMLESYNTYQFIVGERSAGMGGAYTAIANDPTAIWYNPAGLANIRNNRINLSATTYSYLHKNQENFWQAKQTDGSYKGIPLEQTDLSIIPNSLIYSYNIDNRKDINQTISFGLIIPKQDDIKAGIEGRVVGTQSIDIKSVYNIHSRFYVAMIGYGIGINDKLNLGTSIGIGYYQGNGDSTITAYIDTTPNDLIVALYIESNIKMFALMSNIGLQYKINENNKLGLMYSLPAFRIDGEREEIQYEKNNITPANTKIIKKDKYINKLFPAIFYLGYGYEKKESFSIALDLSLHFTNEENPNKVINVRIGSEIYFNRDNIIRLGFFTDFSQKPDVKLSEDLKEKNDIFGLTASYSIAKNFVIIEENRKTENRLWTTIGIIYQLGKGEFNTYRFDENLTSSSTLEKQQFSRITLFIAESLLF